MTPAQPRRTVAAAERRISSSPAIDLVETETSLSYLFTDARALARVSALSHALSPLNSYPGPYFERYSRFTYGSAEWKALYNKRVSGYPLSKDALIISLSWIDILRTTAKARSVGVFTAPL